MRRSRRISSAVRSVSIQKSLQAEMKVEKEEIVSSPKVVEKEEIVSSSEESEVENEIPVKKKKGNDYLKMIEENRLKSLAFLKSLNIDEVKEGFCSSVQTLKPERKPWKRIVYPPPRKKSARLAAMNMDLSEKALYEKAIEDATKVEEEQTTVKVLPDMFSFKESSLHHGVTDVSYDFQKVFSDLEFKEPTKPLQFPDHFKGMKSEESGVCKVVPGRITALTIHPYTDKVLVAAGDKYGNIGFWNVTSNSVCKFHSHTQGITNVMFNTFDTYKLVSSGYDGRLLCGDLEKQVFEKYYESEDFCNCFDVLSRSTFIVGQGSGDVAIVDSRTDKTQTKKHECHEHGMRGLSVHPVDRNFFVSSDVKGFIRVWDLRKLTTEPFCETDLHKRSVSSVYFSPTGKHILSTSLDDQCCIFDSSNLSEGLTVEKNIKHNNCTGRWVSLFKAVWVPNADEQFFAVGSMLQPRRVEIFNLQGNVQNIIDERISTILPRLAFHSHLPVLAGGSSSGRVIILQNL